MSLITRLLVLICLINVLYSGCSRKTQRNESQTTSSPSPSSTTTPVYKSGFSDIFFLDSSHVWAIDHSRKSLYITTDGMSFQKEASGLEGDCRLSFIDSQIGIALCSSNSKTNIWRTTDGGRSWSKTDREIPDFQVDPATKFNFVDPQHGWLMSNYDVWKTQDQGANWEKVFRSEDHPNVGAIVGGGFRDPDAGMIATKEGVYITGDGAKTWQKTNDETGIMAIYVLDKQTAWIWSDGVKGTRDGGKTWRLYDTTDLKGEIISLYFANNLEGWAVGLEVSEGFDSSARTPDKIPVKAILLHTRNGGYGWRKVDAPNDQSFFGVFFSDSSNGWLAGTKQLFRTVDGVTWKPALEVQAIELKID